MKIHDRLNDPFEQQPEDPGNPAGGHPDSLRQTGQNLLAAADEAINRVLSGNSQGYLRANRQQGGQ